MPVTEAGFTTAVRTIISLAVVISSSSSAKCDSLRVAIAQIHCIDSDRDGNLVRIENALAEAVEQDAELVCFPETSLYGWVNPKAHELAQPIPGSDSDSLSSLASKYNIHIAIGLCEKDGANLFDTALLIDNQGKILLKHRKINTLDHLMEPPYKSGEAVATAKTKWGNVGMLICADTFHAETVQRMSEEQPDLLLVPYGWAARQEDWPKHGLSLRDTIANAAKKIGCPIVGPNVVGSISQGPWEGMIYGGQSYATDSQGNVLARGKDRDRDVVVFSAHLDSAE